MPRQNPNLLPSAVNLLAAAGAIRAAVSAGDFESLKAALTAAADGFEQGSAALAVMEQRLRDLSEPNVDLTGRSAPMTVSGDRIRGGVPIQGVLPNLVGQSLDLTFTNQVAHVTSFDHGTGGYLELDLDGLGVTINAHGGTITLTGTISLSVPLTVPMGGTGTATGSITGTGDLTFTAGGSNKTVALVSSGTGRVVAKPGTDSTTAIQLQNAAGTRVMDVDTSNGWVGIGMTPTSLFQVYNPGAASSSGSLVARFRGLAAAATVGSGPRNQFTEDTNTVIGEYGTYIDDATNYGLIFRTYSSGMRDSVKINGNGYVGIGLTVPTSPLQVVGVPIYANNAAAVTGGLTAGALYRTGADPDPVCIVH